MTILINQNYISIFFSRLHATQSQAVVPWAPQRGERSGPGESGGTWGWGWRRVSLRLNQLFGGGPIVGSRWLDFDRGLLGARRLRVLHRGPCALWGVRGPGRSSIGLPSAHLQSPRASTFSRVGEWFYPLVFFPFQRLLLEEIVTLSGSGHSCPVVRPRSPCTFQARRPFFPALDAIPLRWGLGESPQSLLDFSSIFPMFYLLAF